MFATWANDTSLAIQINMAKIITPTSLSKLGYAYEEGCGWKKGESVIKQTLPFLFLMSHRGSPIQYIRFVEEVEKHQHGK